MRAWLIGDSIRTGIAIVSADCMRLSERRLFLVYNPVLKRLICFVRYMHIDKMANWAQRNYGPLMAASAGT